MISNYQKILTFCFLLLAYLPFQAQEIWHESFVLPEKGIWGDDDGTTLHSDFSGITAWSLQFGNVSLSSPDDYAKTVSTSGGRFECCDINGEVRWISEIITIKEFTQVSVTLTAAETGSGGNEQTKFLKAFYILDEKEEIPFEQHAENKGNWGTVKAEQNGLNGHTLQLVVYINNHYASDKVYLDEILVSGKENTVPVLPGDLVINEILFNPFPGGADFVEIYNNSEKEIPVRQLYLASRNNNLELTQIYSPGKTETVLKPGAYLTLTADTNAVFPWYFIQCPECFLQMEKFPSFNNDNDYVVVLNAAMEIVDEFYYDENMHAPLLFDTEGISLERVSFSGNTNNPANWHSASTESGYATPGYKNSQQENPEHFIPEISFVPEAFSPNNDGYNDEFNIFYQLEKPGYYANIWIFDSAGRFVMQLTNNQILGTSGTITWNGANKTGQRNPAGVYVVLVELFDLQGNIKRYKEGVILTDIFE